MINNISAREILFYIILVFPVLSAVVVLCCNSTQDFYFIALTAIESIISVSGIVAGDFSILGEVTPIAMATAIISLMPPKMDGVRHIGILFCFATYILYLYLSHYFSDGAGVGLISAVASDLEMAQKSMLELISSVRTTAAVTVVALLGYKIKS